MTAPTLEPVFVPLRRDASGAYRIADTRVLLELVVRAWHAGATPEEIVQAYDTVKLRDIYVVLAWCLNNESVVADYMTERERQASFVQKELEAFCPDGATLLKSLRNRMSEAGA